MSLPMTSFHIKSATSNEVVMIKVLSAGWFCSKILKNLLNNRELGIYGYICGYFWVYLWITFLIL